VLGVLWSVDGFQETGVAPDATTILGGTGPFAREADGVALPSSSGRIFSMRSSCSQLSPKSYS